MLARAESIEGRHLPLDAQARQSLIRMADGDGRAALTLAEEVWRAARAGEIFDASKLQEVVQRLRVKPWFVYAHRKALGGVAVSARCIRFPESAVERYLARRQ